MVHLCDHRWLILWFKSLALRPSYVAMQSSWNCRSHMPCATHRFVFVAGSSTEGCRPNEHRSHRWTVVADTSPSPRIISAGWLYRSPLRRTYVNLRSTLIPDTCSFPHCPNNRFVCDLCSIVDSALVVFAGTRPSAHRFLVCFLCVGRIRRYRIALLSPVASRGCHVLRVDPLLLRPIHSAVGTQYRRNDGLEDGATDQSAEQDVSFLVRSSPFR